MSERIVLVLHGGGALGAYQSGVYRALLQHLSDEQRRSLIIVGASAGALNGFLIAASAGDADGSARAVEDFWRGVAQPSLPFFPFPHEYWRRLNATLTGLAFGNPPVFTKVPGGALAGALFYPHAAAYDNASLVRALAAWSEGIRSNAAGPRLLVRAVDSMAADTAWFDSDKETVTPAMIAASSAIPLLFKPAEHAGRTYWDGDIWSQGVSPQALDRLQRESESDRFHVISVELFSRQRQRPVGLGANLHQFRNMFLGARSDQDADDTALARERVRVTRIRRAPQPYEQVSSFLFDWAPERIEALIEQGAQDAERALGQERLTAPAKGRSKAVPLREWRQQKRR